MPENKKPEIILEERIRYKTKEYLVKWQDLPMNQASWIRAEEFVTSAPKIARTYEKKKKDEETNKRGRIVTNQDPYKKHYLPRDRQTQN